MRIIEDERQTNSGRILAWLKRRRLELDVINTSNGLKFNRNFVKE
jgi:hypothetical protein